MSHGVLNTAKADLNFKDVTTNRSLVGPPVCFSEQDILLKNVGSEVEANKHFAAITFAASYQVRFKSYQATFVAFHPVSR